MAESTIAARLATLLDETIVVSEAEPVSHAGDDELFLPDVLDSIGLTTLVTLAEEEWNVQFSDDELVPEIFETLSTLAAAIEGKLADSSAPSVPEEDA